MHVGPRPSIERPEGFNEGVDVTTKPSQVKIGKVKPGQTLSVTDSEGHPVTISR